MGFGKMGGKVFRTVSPRAEQVVLKGSVCSGLPAPSAENLLGTLFWSVKAISLKGLCNPPACPL